MQPNLCGGGRESRSWGQAAQDRHPGLIPAWSTAGTRTKHPHEHPSHTPLSQLVSSLASPFQGRDRGATLPKHSSTRRCWKAGWCLMPTKSFRKTKAPEGQPAARDRSGGTGVEDPLPYKDAKGPGLQGRAPQPNPGEQVLWQNHTKARREETRSSFHTVSSCG